MHKQIEDQELITDPVCGMKGKPEDWIEHEYSGKKYYFCNQSCVVEFKKNPEKYIEIEEDKEIITPIKEVEEHMGKLKCVECGSEQDLPMHCGQAMHKEGYQLVCWMGASCGAQPIPEHHGKPMEVVE